MPKPKLLTLKQFEAATGISANTTKTAAQRGNLPATQQGYTWFVDMADPAAQEWIGKWKAKPKRRKTDLQNTETS